VSEGGQVLRLIAKLPADSQRRVWVMAQILRELIEKSGEEAELAFTLVLAELADDGFTAGKGVVESE
jgi:hypothetical protein